MDEEKPKPDWLYTGKSAVPEQVKSDPVTERKRQTLDWKERQREASSELERSIAEQQAARYESALLHLMRRTGDNPELINAMNGFIDAIEQRGMYGDGESPMDPQSEAVQKMTRFFTEAREQLWYIVGNRSGNIDPWIK